MSTRSWGWLIWAGIFSRYHLSLEAASPRVHKEYAPGGGSSVTVPIIENLSGRSPGRYFLLTTPDLDDGSLNVLSPYTCLLRLPVRLGNQSSELVNG